MYEKLENCPVCKNTNFQNHLICKDHSVSSESFALSKCQSCQLVFTNPRPGENELSNYYLSENYISHTSKASNIINLIYKLVRVYTIRGKLRIIKKYNNGKNVLDYGCGTGDFLYHLNKKGYTTSGYEPSEIANKLLDKRSINRVKNIQKDTNKYDVITAWHVIEHVPDPRKTVKTLSKKLAENGVMFIAVPNVLCFDALHYKENWAAYDVPRHLYHFSQQSFGKLIEKCKLKLVDTIPMKFDSYYVSMLSEKYSHGKNNLASALKIGYRSNKLAKKNGEYSSLIYVLKK